MANLAFLTVILSGYTWYIALSWLRSCLRLVFRCSLGRGLSNLRSGERFVLSTLGRHFLK